MFSLQNLYSLSLSLQQFEKFQIQMIFAKNALKMMLNVEYSYALNLLLYISLLFFINYIIPPRTQRDPKNKPTRTLLLLLLSPHALSSTTHKNQRTYR